MRRALLPPGQAILHFYEFAGRETPERDLVVVGDEVRLTVKPYQIKSVRVEFAAPPAKPKPAAAKSLRRP